MVVAVCRDAGRPLELDFFWLLRLGWSSNPQRGNLVSVNGQLVHNDGQFDCLGMQKQNVLVRQHILENVLMWPLACVTSALQAAEDHYDNGKKFAIQ